MSRDGRRLHAFSVGLLFAVQVAVVTVSVLRWDRLTGSDVSALFAAWLYGTLGMLAMSAVVRAMDEVICEQNEAERNMRERESRRR